MNRRVNIALVSLVSLAGLTVSLGFVQNSSKTKTPPASPAGKSTMPSLPPGMTEQDMKDMQVCMEAATPGPMQAKLAESHGNWTGTNAMWQKPGSDAMKSPCTSTATPFMDGRFTKVEVTSEMPGMGQFKGFGIYGYDNVSKQFQATWVDNMGTGIMNGTGELAADGTMTWTYHYTCPITNKAVTMREVQKHTGKDTMVQEMYGIDPHTGKEFKMMEISMTRQPGSGAMTKADK